MRNLKILIGLAAVTLFLACNTYNKQLRTYHAFSYEHPGELAKDCAKQFPVKDSVGKVIIDSTHKAANVNYKSTIDSLLDQINRLNTDIQAMVVNKDNPCATVALSYQKQVLTLSDKVKALQAGYKPCKPDTVYKSQTVYKRDVALERVLQDKLTNKTDSLNLVESQLKDCNKTGRTRLWIIIGLSLILVGSVAAKIYKLI